MAVQQRRMKAVEAVIFRRYTGAVFIIADHYVPDTCTPFQRAW